MIDHNEFIVCLHGLRCARVVFISKKDDGALRERICAPIDFGPDRRAADKRDRYHFFDIEAGHPLRKFADEIVTFAALTQSFDPATFVTWDLRQHPWWVQRDWGLHS